MEWSFQAEIQPGMSRGVERESPYCFRGAVGELGKHRWWERALFRRKWVWTVTFIHSTTNTWVPSGCQVCASCLGYEGGHGGSWVWRRSAGSGRWGSEGTAVERVCFWEPSLLWGGEFYALTRAYEEMSGELWRGRWDGGGGSRGSEDGAGQGVEGTQHHPGCTEIVKVQLSHEPPLFSMRTFPRKKCLWAVIFTFSSLE